MLTSKRLVDANLVEFGATVADSILVAGLCLAWCCAMLEISGWWVIGLLFLRAVGLNIAKTRRSE